MGILNYLLSFFGPSAVPSSLPPRARSGNDDTFADVGLQILGVGVNYPELSYTQKEGLKTFSALYPNSPAMDKVLEIGEKTGIKTRGFCFKPDHPVIYQKDSPPVEQQGELYLTAGVDLATGAARKAIAEWGGELSEITHIVGVSSMAFSNPGFEFHVAKKLGLDKDVDRTFVHGVGCSGGLAALRTAAQITCGASFMGKKARVLVVSLELGVLSARNELDQVHRTQEVRIPATLFADASSALILGNNIGENPASCKPVYELIGWKLFTLQDCERDIALDLHHDGWRVTLSPRVPKLTSSSVPAAFAYLTSHASHLLKHLGPSPSPADFDWAIHPGGAKILTDTQKLMNLTQEHCRASWDIYENHGNTASATIFSVLNRLRKDDMGEGREFVVSFAFGPGVSVETAFLRRIRHADAKKA